MLPRPSAVSVLSACKALHNAVAESLAAGGLAAASQQLPVGAAAAAAAATGSLLQQHRQKHTVRMVLLQDHDKLGKRGNLVQVKAGYARYTLFPQGIADYAIQSVMKNLWAQGLLSAEAQLQLSGAGKQSGAAGHVDPATLPAEQQLPQILELLLNQPVVVSRRFNREHPEQPMIGEVTAQHLAARTAHQLKVQLPPELIMMRSHEPIKHFGSFKVPLNLKNEQGQQVELEVVVQKTYRRSRVRSHNERLFAQQQQL